MDQIAIIILWVLDTVLNFAVHALPLFALIGFVAYRFERALMAKAAAIGAVICAVAIITGYRHGVGPDPDLEGTRLRVISVNIEAATQNHEEKLRFLRDSGADVVLVQEANPRWWEAMQALGDLYPHRVRGGPIGVFVLSKHPFTRPAEFLQVPWPHKDFRPVYLQPDEGIIRGLRVPIRVGGQTLTLIDFHATKPDTPAKYAARAGELERLDAWLAQTQGPLLLAGDFNATPMAVSVQKLVAGNELSALAPGLFRPLGTWPAAAPWAGFQIDHLFLRGDIGAEAYYVGPDVGSNHRPLIADLVIHGPS